jgi:fucose permease
MAEDKKIDKKDISFIIGGAIIGAIAGYIVKRVGIKNIMNMIYYFDALRI